MGNVPSAQHDGELAGGVLRHTALDTSIQGSNKSWATMDHTLSGPWSFLVKEEVQCLCEGGRNCSHENPARQRGGNAVTGLHSSWVCGDVLAMARPWQENVLKHDVVSQFKKHNIGMILNLQEVGEHDSCGPGNMAASGFTYNPETFMAAKIGVYNISWRDMGVPTLEKIMDIVQIMQYTTLVECRKVAVHCHAGLGRTGLAIACYLLASGQASTAARAVETVCAARPGSLQTQAQVMFVSIFEQYLQHLRCLFKVADLKQLSLGNTNYVVTKVCRRISRSLSGQHQLSNAATPDALAVAAAALGPFSYTPAGSGGSGVSTSAAAPGTAAAAATPGQPDWASATYDIMSPSEAAQLAGAAQSAANAALNLGTAQDKPGAGRDGLVTHARRLSGGGAMKLVSNLKAIDEEGDKPVHVIQTDNSVTEVYGHGLTIIQATDSAKKLRGWPAKVKVPEHCQVAQQLPSPHELGLDKQLPWNDTFAIRPEAFKSEGWLPDPPASYLEALRRQQRLLHGNERRRCLHQHKLLRSAAKALAAAAEAYNAAALHADPSQVAPSTSGAVSPQPAFKRMHTRSRSNASAIDLLAVAGGLSPTSSSIPQSSELPHTLSTGNSMLQRTAGPAPATAAGSESSTPSPSNSLLSKQQQQQQQQHSQHASPLPALPAAARLPGAAAAPNSAAALPPGLHLGPPGTKPSTSSANIAEHAMRKLNRQASSKKGSAQSPSTAAASSEFFLPSSSDDSNAAAQAATGAAGGSVCCTPCLAGCCAPSFVVGVLIALLYKGRFPEEYEAQWSGCPRLKALGLDEGYAVCQALQDVKLAANAGSYAQLESASGAVAVCVLADWFEGFSQEAFSEATLELLVDDAEALLAEALAAAANKAAQQQPLQQPSQGPGAAGGPTSSSNTDSIALPELTPAQLAVGNQEAAVDAAALARKASALAICSTLAPFEQDLCLLLAAVLRHARHASLGDSRLPEGGSFSGGSSSMAGSRSASAAGSGLSGSGAGCGVQWALVEAQVDAAMAVLYRLVAGWLLGPLALDCLPALEAVAAFLHYLTVDDTAYGCLLQAIQQGVRRVRSAPAGKGLHDSLGSAPDSGPNSPRVQQQQQNQDRLEKLKARLLGAGSSFNLKPFSASHRASKQAAAGSEPHMLGPALTNAAACTSGSGSTHGGAAAAVQHSLGKSKLRHVSSSPELCNIPQHQQQSLHAHASPTSARHAKSKLGQTAFDSIAAGVAAPSSNVHSSSQEHARQAGEPSAVQPEPRGCADALTQLLSHKLHSLSGKKHQPPPLPDAVPQQSSPGLQEQAPQSTPLPHQRQQQQQQQSLQQQQQQQQQQHASGPVAGSLSPMASVGSSCCGDSMSEVITAGNCHQLCVGGQVQSEAGGDSHLQEQLAVLPGQRWSVQELLQQPEPSMLQSNPEGSGLLDSPPRSVSPEPLSTLPSGGRRPAVRVSGGGIRQHPHGMHVRLPPMPDNSYDASSDAGSSFTSSPCSSLGSITGLLVAAQQQQQQQCVQQKAKEAEAAPAVGTASVGGAATPAGRLSAAGGPSNSSSDLSGKQAVSVSALSDLHLQHSGCKVLTGQ